MRDGQTEGYTGGCKRRREKNKAKVKEWAKHIKVPFLHCTERRFYPHSSFLSPTSPSTPSPSPSPSPLTTCTDIRTEPPIDGGIQYYCPSVSNRLIRTAPLVSWDKDVLLQARRLAATVMTSWGCACHSFCLGDEVATGGRCRSAGGRSSECTRERVAGG